MTVKVAAVGEDLFVEGREKMVVAVDLERSGGKGEGVNERKPLIGCGAGRRTRADGKGRRGGAGGQSEIEALTSRSFPFRILNTRR